MNSTAEASESDSDFLTTASPDPIKAELFKRLTELLKSYVCIAEAEGPKQLLYHYTSAEGARGILSSNSLWLTNLRYVNDTSELTYGIEVAKSVIKKIGPYSKSDVLQAAMETASNEIQSLFDPIWDVYAICFCESHKVLSQWRNYAGLEGFSLGFDFSSGHEFIPVNAGQTIARKLNLGKVLYDPKKQEGLIRETMNLIESWILKISESNVSTDWLTGILRSFFLNTIPFFKDEIFEEEKEWRLYFPIQNFRQESRAIKFRTWAHGILPYLELHSAKGQLPIRQAWVGPSMFAEANKKVIKMMAKTWSPSVQVYILKAPLTPGYGQV